MRRITTHDRAKEAARLQSRQRAAKRRSDRKKAVKAAEAAGELSAKNIGQ